MRKKQLEFELLNHKSKIGKPFGGGRANTHPKIQRPFSSKHTIHLILKSSRAKGRHSFLHFKNRKIVDRLVKTQAEKAGIELKDYVNVGNHLHIQIKARRKESVTKFLRVITGLLPRRLYGCERGKSLGFKFWDARPYTKIVAAGVRPFQTIRRYFLKNRDQARSRVEGFDFWANAKTSSA